MKKLIYSNSNENTLSYRERNELAEDLFEVVEEFFELDGQGSPKPTIRYRRTDDLEYTFRIFSSDDESVPYIAHSSHISSFKKSIESVLQSWGFDNIEFDIRDVDQDYKWLVAIYFA